jgi:hypothetical protein
MYNAMILMCLYGEVVNINNCTVIYNQFTYETEIECIDSIAEFLNDEMFSVVYNDYKLEKIECYEWINSSESKT